MKEFLLKASLVGILFIILLWEVSNIFINNFRERGDTNGTESFYYLEPNTLDVVLVGSSHIYCGFDPILLKDEFGIEAYDLATPNQSLVVDYLWAKEAYEKQKYKVLILDANSFYTVWDDQFDTNLRSLYAMRPSRHYFEYIKYIGKSKALKVVFPVFALHDQWRNLRRDAFVKLDRETVNHRGLCTPSEDSQAGEEYNHLILTGESADFERNLPTEHLDEIKSFCDENEIKLIMVKSVQVENDGNVWNDYRHNSILNVCNERGITFIDFNEEKHIKECDINLAVDVASDLRHANANGAKKETRYLGKYLLNILN